MASGDREFDDSSGYSTRLNNMSTNPKGFLPHALELKDIPVQRDSGCYTGSPAMNSTSTSVRRSSGTQFGFEEGDTCVTPRALREYPYPLHSTPSTLTASSASLTSSDTDQFHMESDDEVFESLEDSDTIFIDSGIQSIGLNSGDHTALFDENQEEPTSDTETDGEATTDDEVFVTAELVPLGNSPVSSPIDIPTRSHNSSHEEDSDDTASATAASAPPLASHPPLTRRQTVIGQLNTGDRPHSGNGRMQGNSVLVVESEGPLPDVVPNEPRRARALSESAVSSYFLARRLGTSLRDISDEFCHTSRNRQRNLNLMQQLQQNVGSVGTRRQGNSYPLAGKKSGNFFNNFFKNSPKE